MRRKAVIVGLVVLAAGGFLVAGGGTEPARAEGGASGWTWYTWWLQMPEVKTGANVGYAATPWFGVDLAVTALRTTWVSGTEEGSRKSSGWGLVGIKVVNPKAANLYTWKAECVLEDSILRARVTLGDLGEVCGRADACAQVRVFGDLKMSCARSVAAKDFRGGKWALSIPPTYTSPFTSQIIAYKKAEDGAVLMGHDASEGSGTHAQVRGQTRVCGGVLAHCQTGIDRRFALSNAGIGRGATVTLKGYTATPMPDGRPPIPMIGSDLHVSGGTVTVSDSDIDGEDLSPGKDENGEDTGQSSPPPPPEGRDPDDFRPQDW